MDITSTPQVAAVHSVIFRLTVLLKKWTYDWFQSSSYWAPSVRWLWSRLLCAWIMIMLHGPTVTCSPFETTITKPTGKLARMAVSCSSKSLLFLLPPEHVALADPPLPSHDLCTACTGPPLASHNLHVSCTSSPQPPGWAILALSWPLTQHALPETPASSCLPCILGLQQKTGLLLLTDVIRWYHALQLHYLVTTILVQITVVT